MGCSWGAPEVVQVESDEDEPSEFTRSIIPLSSVGSQEIEGSQELSFHPSAFLSSSEFDLLFKILLIGESGVGKSSILLRFAEDSFQDVQGVTIGVDFKIRTIVIDGKRVKLQIWDTAGQERFRTVARAYFRGTHGVIVVYDITNRNSFNAMHYWFEQLAIYAPSNCIKLIVGNKLDRAFDRAVSSEEAAAHAQEQNVLYLETSAREKTNILEAFEMLAREIKNRISTAGSTPRYSTGR